MIGPLRMSGLVFTTTPMDERIDDSRVVGLMATISSQAASLHSNYIETLPFAPAESDGVRFGTIGGRNAQLRTVTNFIFGGIEFRPAHVALAAYRIYFDYADATIDVNPNM